jgi:transcription elongation GreA/GreB family factor
MLLRWKRPDLTHRRRMIDTSGIVRIGSHVCIQDADGEAEFRLVQPEDADAVAERVSCESPLGRALLGRRAGDQVWFRAPGGVLTVTVVAVG